MKNKMYCLIFYDVDFLININALKVKKIIDNNLNLNNRYWKEYFILCLFRNTVFMFLCEH